MDQDEMTYQEERLKLSEEQVAEYLQDHPHFFKHWENLLSDLKLPHQSGQAVSLVEKQVSILRDRNMDLRHRLSHLLDAAKENDQLFDKTKLLTLSLLEAGNMRTIAQKLEASMHEDFGLDAVSLILYDGNPKDTHKILRILDQSLCEEKLSGLLQGNKIICGPLRDSQAQFLFPFYKGNIGSVCLAPLHFRGTIGLLSIGSNNPAHFKSSMGTIFISYIRDILSRVLRPFLVNLSQKI